tara:strand:+ start:16446 stop:18986 length:2541 start_codon:yes stop_codon:yes gene_type:complete
MPKQQEAIGRSQPFVKVQSPPIIAQRTPATTDTDYPKGATWIDESVSPSILYVHIGGGDWNSNELTLSTDGTFAGALDTTASSSLAIKTYADALAIAAAPVSTVSTSGIGKLVTNANAVARLASTGVQAYFVQPSNLTAVLSDPGPIGDTTASTVDCTDLVADGLLDLDTTVAGHIKVTGAADFTVESTLGAVILNAEEAAADAIQIQSAAGGLDLDVALGLDMVCSENAADAIILNASAGGIDITAAGGAGEDIDIVNTAGSVNITAGESAGNSIVISSTIGGIDITAAGAAAGEDIDISSTGSSVNISASENAADSITIVSSAGGIDILASGAAAGEDIDIAATGSSVNISSTEDVASAIYLRANGGTSETVKIHSDLGTGVASIDLLSDVGGITLTSGLASNDAVNIAASAGGLDVDVALQMSLVSSEAATNAIVIDASNAAGGIDVDCGSGGLIVDAAAGAISLDSALASNFTVTGAADLSLISTLGSVNVNAEEADAQAISLQSAAGGLDVDVALQMSLVSSQAATTAIVIDASDAAGGIDVDCGSGGFIVDAAAGAVSLDSALASNFTVTGAADLSLISTLGSVNINAEEADASAISLQSAAGGLNADVALQMNLASSQNAADAIVISASAGGIDVTATGAAGEDLDLVCTSGSANLSGGEAIANAVVISAGAGGIDITAPGAGAGLDIDIVNTGGSVNVTATESAADAIVINASGAAGAVQVLSGTGGVVMDSGLTMNVTAVATAASPYTVLGSDYIIDTNSTGGALAITMPAAPATGRKYLIYDGVGQAAIGGNVTITGTAGNIAAGGASAATYVLNTAFESLELTWNGTLWMGRAVV